MGDLPPKKEKNKLKSWGLGILFGKLNLGGHADKGRGVFSFKITTEDRDLSTELSIPVILHPPPFAINRSDWAPVRLLNA